MAYYGGGLLAINCYDCIVVFNNCNFARGGIGGLDLGKGSANDGGFFFISGVKEFTVKNSNFEEIINYEGQELFLDISN